VDFTQGCACTALLPFMRYNLHETRENQYYKHGIQVKDMLTFHQVRRWLTDTYGFSEGVDKAVELNPVWSFHMIYRTYMFYLRGDEELSWFQIRYGAPNE